MTSIRYDCSFALLAFCQNSLVHAQQYPTWELGAGVAAVSAPQYAGSNQRSNWVLPVPYFVYRGEHWRIDREAITDQLFKLDQWQLDLSFGLAPPVRSTDNHARQGMPDLNPAFEAGIALKRRLWSSADHDSGLRFTLPLRAVEATNLRDFDYAGLVTEPTLIYTIGMLDPEKLHYNLSLAPRFASTRNNAYFYQVDSAYATADRPQYTARGGYAGTHLTLGATQRLGHWWMGAFVRYDNLHGASFEDSPLVKTRDDYWLGFALSYVFMQSNTMARSAE